jgi:hypothetical protein
VREEGKGRERDRNWENVLRIFMLLTL